MFRTLLAVALVTFGAAQQLVYTPVPSAEVTKDFTKAGLAAAGKTAEEMKAIEKRIADAAAATPPTTPAVADTTASTKYQTAFDTAKTAWITANTKTLTAEEVKTVLDEAKKELTAQQITDQEAYEAAVDAGTTPTAA